MPGPVRMLFTFARQGHRVHATDIAAGMQEVAIKKIKETK
jgi:hypothetical protein